MILYIDLGTIEIKVYKRWFRKSYILKRYKWRTRQIPLEGGGSRTSWYSVLDIKNVITEEEYQKLRITNWDRLWKSESNEREEK